jgi:cation diffusion facilitator family transporter
MPAEGSARVVLTALGANLGVAAAKFVAAAITGSASMLAEGVHSVADSGNQVLLLIGGRRSRQAPSSLHPFGYARQRYIYAFLVAVVLFTLGGLYALYEGYHKIVDPHPLSSPLVAVAVLLIGTALEGYALRTAIREANQTRGTRGWLHFIRRARAPELPVLLLEDSGALVGLTLALLGVGLSIVTGNGVFDGIASLCIGALLATIAVLLARETTSLLIGEAAVPNRSTKSTTRCCPPPASTGLSTCAPCTSDQTNYWSPARSPYPARPTAPTSPPPSTTQKPASAKHCPPRGSSTSSPTSTGRRSRPANNSQRRSVDLSGRGCSHARNPGQDARRGEDRDSYTSAAK